MGDSTLLPRILSVKPVWPWPTAVRAAQRAMRTSNDTPRKSGCRAAQSAVEIAAELSLRCERCARCRIFPALAAPRRRRAATAARFEALVQHHQRLDHRASGSLALVAWAAAGALRLPAARHAVHQYRHRNPRNRPQNRWSAPPAASPRRSSRSRRRSSPTAPRATPPRCSQNCLARCASTRRRRASSATPRPACDYYSPRARRRRRAIAPRSSNSSATRPLLRAWRRTAIATAACCRIGPRRCRPFSTPTSCRCRRRSGKGRAAPRSARRGVRRRRRRRRRRGAALLQLAVARSDAPLVKLLCAFGLCAGRAAAPPSEAASEALIDALSRATPSAARVVGDGGRDELVRSARRLLRFHWTGEAAAAPGRRTSPPFCSRTSCSSCCSTPTPPPPPRATPPAARRPLRRPRHRAAARPRLPLQPAAVCDVAAAALALEARVAAGARAHARRRAGGGGGGGGRRAPPARADAAAADAAGVTPAHLAAEGGGVALLRLLHCAGGASPSARATARPRPAARRRRGRAGRGLDLLRSLQADESAEAADDGRAGATRRPAPPPRCARRRRRRPSGAGWSASMLRR